jgi:hypothetical protein
MIKDFKDLEKLFKLCRKQGIAEMDFNGIKFTLGELPSDIATGSNTQESDPVDPYKDFPTGDLTQEQLLFYSSGGLPSEDPYRKDTQ